MANADQSKNSGTKSAQGGEGNQAKSGQSQARRNDEGGGKQSSSGSENRSGGAGDRS